MSHLLEVFCVAYVLPFLFRGTWSATVDWLPLFLILLLYFRGEDSLKEYLEVKTVTIKMPYKIWIDVGYAGDTLLQLNA
jgi:hypothetical protein